MSMCLQAGEPREDAVVVQLIQSGTDSWWVNLGWDHNWAVGKGQDSIMDEKKKVKIPY